MALKLFELLGADDRRFSPYCWRARMAIAHKKLEVEYVPCKFTDKALFAFSGGKTVPVLQDGDAVFTDSWDIACHLEEAYSDRPSLFGGAIGRGEARFIAEWISSFSRPLLMTILKDIFDHVHPDDKVYFRESREERVGQSLESIHAQRESYAPALEAGKAPLRAVLTKQPFICGDMPAYGDYIVFGAFQWARCIRPHRLLEKGDVLYDWRGSMLELFDGLGRRVAAYPE